MRVTKQQIENAVLKIFADFQIPAGGRLLFTDLRAHWSDTQLRGADLMEGVKRLTYDGLIELDDSSEGPLFILSEAGYARAHALPIPKLSDWKDLLAQSMSSFSLRRRTPVAAAHGHGRRAGDALVAG